MSAIVPAAMVTLPALVDRAVTALANARTAAEVLEARDLASSAYDAAKKAARLGQAKMAHDELIAAAYRAQADALAIESEAKRRLADEYDAAQERGEVQRHGRVEVSDGNLKPATLSEIGLTKKQVHEARMIRNAEQAEPGIVRRTVDEAVATGEEPTKAKVRRAVMKASAKKGRSKPKVRYARAPQSVDPEPRHDADLRRLEVAWQAACETARSEFLRSIGYEAGKEAA
jgi:hypothetical protein